MSSPKISSVQLSRSNLYGLYDNTHIFIVKYSSRRYSEAMNRMPRRGFLKKVLELGAAIGVGSLPLPADANTPPFKLFESSLSEPILKRHRDNAIASLTHTIPNDPKLSHLHTHARHLKEESQMYIPQNEELRDVVRKSERQLNEFAARIAPQRYGLFVFADIGSNGRRVQRMYVIKRTGDNALHFEKAYKVSMARRGFGNELDSEQTPLGLHSINSGHRGYFGEVVSGLNKYRDAFIRTVINGVSHWFVKGFGSEPGNDVAEVVTDQYLLQGPKTDPSRGIRIHGTNRSGEIGPDGTWRSFLGGARLSGGCIRMSNVDVRDLSLSGYLPVESETLGAVPKMVTPVFIHATPAAQEARTDAAGSGQPPRRKLGDELPQKAPSTQFRGYRPQLPNPGEGQ